MVHAYSMAGKLVGTFTSIVALEEFARVYQKLSDETGLSLHGELEGQLFSGEYALSTILS